MKNNYNNANLTFESEGYSRRKLLNRKWKAEVKRTEPLKTEIRFDLNQIAERFDNQDSIWLAIDQSGIGEFLEGTTKYYPSTKINKKVTSQDQNFYKKEIKELYKDSNIELEKTTDLNLKELGYY